MSISTDALPVADALAIVTRIRALLARRLRSEIHTPALTEELSCAFALLDAVDFSRCDEERLRASHHPIAGILQKALVAPSTVHDAGTESPETEGIADLLALLYPCLSRFPWRYSYDARPDMPDIGARMAWAELVGPVAPFKSHSVCLGITAMDAGLFYPIHAHPAVETYVVLFGTAEWTLENETRARPPGALILHPSDAAHAMRAGADSPLLAVYTWRGEVETLSRYLESSSLDP
ncbi:MAG: AraC family ligand binding domain-containing protein [Zoogloeaceae bacterium]|nr:AraC family ligand binding domain-containing protein [Zoogloeaceae bacterium]